MDQGHNSISADELRLLVERVERLEEEKLSLSADVKDVYSEAKARGYDAKVMRKLVALRRLQPHERQEQDDLLRRYRAVMGL